jgi:hypothetical protein
MIFYWTSWCEFFFGELPDDDIFERFTAVVLLYWEFGLLGLDIMALEPERGLSLDVFFLFLLEKIHINVVLVHLPFLHPNVHGTKGLTPTHILQAYA